MINFDEVLTFSEAAEKWGLADGKSVRKAVERGRFQPYEIKKSGNVWLTTYEAMQRVFGEPRMKKTMLYYRDIIASRHVDETLRIFFDKAQEAIEAGDVACVVESREHPERILYILKTKEELEQQRHRLRYFLQMQFTMTPDN